MPEFMHEGTGFHLPCSTVSPPGTQGYDGVVATYIGKSGDSVGLAGGNRKVRVRREGVGKIC